MWAQRSAACAQGCADTRSRTMRTAARVRGLILQQLACGGSVEVLVASPPAPAWAGLPVDPVAGLEQGLIAALAPAWNIRGKPDASGPP
jgi:hypothetical protein